MIKPLIALALAAVSLAVAAASTTPARRVVIAPVQVAFDKNWLGDMNDSRTRPNYINAQDARRIADDMAASLASALDEAVRARGFEVVTAPAGDALQLSTRIDDLYVNAPDITAPGINRNFVREAGRVTLRAEGRDASGTVRVQTERKAAAGDTGQLQRTSDVANRFWFDSLFKAWAKEVAAELGEKPSR